MIIDKIENFSLYNFGSAWQSAFEFLSILTPDSSDGKYTIDGDDIFAIEL